MANQTEVTLTDQICNLILNSLPTAQLKCLFFKLLWIYTPETVYSCLAFHENSMLSFVSVTPTARMQLQHCHGYCEVGGPNTLVHAGS